MALAACALDLLLGDPAWMPHPVVLMGKAIERAERALRRAFPSTPRGELAAGAVLALGLPTLVLAASAGALWLAGLVHPALRLALACLWGWQCLALRDLRDESMAVRRALDGGTLEDARRAVHRIVGRDVERLDRRGVARAAVESVAESFSDGFMAPLLYLLAGGPALALWYKAVNTQDSMIGYRSERYLWFGRVAARLDDVANWIPARLSGLLIVAAAFVCGLGPGAGEAEGALPAGERGRAACARRAWRVWRRDRRRHASPNAGQTEAAMAGALGVELAGPAWYFGERYDKPTIGDALRDAGPADIARANRLVWAAAGIGLAALAALRLAAWQALG